MTALDSAGASRWMRITSGSFTWRVWADVLDAAHRPLSVPPIPVVACQVSQGDGTDRFSASLTVPVFDPTNPVEPVKWAPDSFDDVLAPFGNRLRLWMEVNGDDESQRVVLGIGLIVDVEATYPEGELSVSLADLSAEVGQARLESDMPSAAQKGWSHWQAAVELLNAARVPRKPTLNDAGQLVSRTAKLPEDLSWNAGGDLWDLMQEAVGLSHRNNRVVVDRAGAFRVIRADWSDDAPAPLSAPDAVFTDGYGGHLVSLRSRLSREGAVNRVRVIVEDSNVGEQPSGTVTPADNAQALRPPSNADIAQAITVQALRNVQQAVTIARGEVGTGREPGGWIKYQRVFPAYSNFYVEYCGIFVAWVLQHRMNIPPAIKGKEWVRTLAYVPTAKADLARWTRRDSPKMGDIVLFTWQHVGLVVSATGWPRYVETVEGNVGNRVANLRQSPGAIHGFVTPNWARLVRGGEVRDGDPADTSSAAAVDVVEPAVLSPDRGTLGLANRVEVIRLKDPRTSFAADRAKELLAQSQGVPKSLSADLIPQPWLDPDDVVEVKHNNTTTRLRVGSWSMSADADGSLSFTVQARDWSAVKASELVLPGGLS